LRPVRSVSEVDIKKHKPVAERGPTKRVRDPETNRARAKTWLRENKERRRAYVDQYLADNGERIRAADRERYQRQKARYRPAWLKRAYGLTVAQWDDLLESQGGRCAICGTDDPRHSNGWSTDHSHDTGAVRGILCSVCNRTLGMLGDSRCKVTERVSLILQYLTGKD
jgi:hypothetical protein